MATSETPVYPMYRHNCNWCIFIDRIDGDKLRKYVDDDVEVVDHYLCEFNRIHVLRTGNEETAYTAIYLVDCHYEVYNPAHRHGRLALG